MVKKLGIASLIVAALFGITAVWFPSKPPVVPTGIHFRNLIRSGNLQEIHQFISTLEHVDQMLPMVLNPIGGPDGFGDQAIEPFYIALNENNVEVVNMLLEQGSNPQRLFSLVYGKTPPAILESLLKHGADPNSLENGGAELLGAANPESALILLRHGANPDIRDAKGVTPLMLAARHWKVERIEVLLQFGAKPEIADSNGFRAIDYACGEKFTMKIDGIQPPCPDNVRKLLAYNEVPKETDNQARDSVAKY